jgi:cell division protein FtsW (lipid II flippase)
VFGDKPGWFLSIVCCALYVVTFFRSSQANMESTQPYYAFFKSYSIMALLFLAMLILLIQKPFRKKYQATAKNWLWIAIIIIVVIIDKIIF